MAIQYPTQLDSLLTIPKVTDLVSPVRASDHNILVDAALAIEEELGTNPSGVYATVKDRLDAIQSGNFSEFLLEKGDLITSTGSGPYRFEVGPDGYSLIADSTQPGGLRWELFIDDDSGGTVTGTGVNTRIAFWNSASSITSSGNLTFDGSNIDLVGEIRPDGGIRFLDGTLQTTAIILGANTQLSNLTVTDINTHLFPHITDGYDLGSPLLRWQDGYFGQLSVNGLARFNESNSVGGDLQVSGVTTDYLIFTDASEDKVGIKNSAPSRTLHVGGDGYFQGYVSIQDSSVPASTAGSGALKWTTQSVEFSDGYAWRKLFRTVGAAVRNLWVDPVAGTDAGPGTEAIPLKTIQEAVYRFKQQDNSQASWDRADDRTIHVLHTTDMPRIVEKVRIPPHNGSGFLRILAEEQLHQSGLTQVGAIASIAGFTVRNRITVAESIPAGAYADSAFVKPTNNITNRVLEDTWDDLPIVTNGTNTIDVTAYSPGSFSAFYYGPGQTLDIVMPQIVWSWPDLSASEFYSDAPLIVNEGSPLIISGFIFETQRVATGFGGIQTISFIANSSTTSADYAIGSPVVATRCIFIPGFSDNDTFNTVDSLIYGSGTGITGSLVTLETCTNLCEGRGVQFLNVRLHDGYGDLWPRIQNYSAATMYLDMTNRAGHGTTAIIVENNSRASFVVDFRGGHLICRGNSLATFSGTIEGAASNSAIEVTDGSHLTITTASGSTGNDGYGASIGVLSSIIANALPTLTGADGDVEVGQMPAQSWSQGIVVDVIEMATYRNLS